MRIVKRSTLFGGALFAAGITGATHAQWTIDPSDPDETTARIFAGGSAGHVQYFSEGMTDVSFDLNSYNDPDIGGSVGATISNSSISAYLNINSGQNGIEGDGYAFVIVEALINVSSDSKVLAEWDLTDYSSSASGGLQVFDLTNDMVVLLFEAIELGTSGSMSIDLQAGHQYLVRAGVISGTSANMFASFTKAPVPTPGTLALLGIAALGARRRRRE